MHVHCLRNEQCTYAYDLNKMKMATVMVCMFDQVLDQTKLLAKS